MRYQNSPIPSRIVVRGPNFLGDCVLASTFFEHLRKSHPQARIVFVGLPVAAQFVSGTAWFDEVWTLPNKKFSSLVAMARRLRNEHFDLAVSLPSSVSAALLFWLARARQRVGYAEPLARWMYHASRPWPGRSGGRHKSELYSGLLSLLGIPQPSATEPWVEGASATQPSKTADSARYSTGDYFVLAPGASIALRQWPHAAEFVKLLLSGYPGSRVVLVGNKDDEMIWGPQFQAVLSMTPQLLAAVDQRMGKTSLAQVGELCRGARAVITMDSGLAHFSATVVGAPTLVVFGPGDPQYIAPRGGNVGIARLADLACSPCESAVCNETLGYQTCLKQLSPQAVLAELNRLVG